MPKNRPREWNAKSFRLPPDQTGALWPADGRWTLSGWRFGFDRPGRLTFEVLEARNGRVIARLASAVKDTHDFVIAGTFPNAGTGASELVIFELLADAMCERLRVTVPEWARPSAGAVEKDDNGWVGARGGHYHGEDDERRVLRAFSWNGPMTETWAQRRHPNPAGDGRSGRIGSIRVGDQPRKNPCFELPLAQWPEPVWFVRVHYQMD